MLKYGILYRNLGRLKMTNQDNNHQLNHRIYHFEKIYKAIKHVIVFIFMIFIAIVAIAVIAMSLYFHHLTKTSDSLSDDALIKSSTNTWR